MTYSKRYNKVRRYPQQRSLSTPPTKKENIFSFSNVLGIIGIIIACIFGYLGVILSIESQNLTKAIAQQKQQIEGFEILIKNSQKLDSVITEQLIVSNNQLYLTKSGLRKIMLERVEIFLS
ncbi:MAG: hypothetical protein ACYDEC_15615 [Bacteroidia bacterium]